MLGVAQSDAHRYLSQVALHSLDTAQRGTFEAALTVVRKFLSYKHNDASDNTERPGDTRRGG